MCNQTTDPAAQTPVTPGILGRTEHIHQVGNDRITAIVSNFGHVRVRQDEGVVQVNLSPETILLPTLAQPVELLVELLVKPDLTPEQHAASVHAVYRAVPPDEAGHEEHDVEVVGVVRGLNHALHGEPNGVVLDSGNFVHLKPEGMKRLNLSVGQRVVARGKARPMATGRCVLDAESVNGVMISRKK